MIKCTIGIGSRIIYDSDPEVSISLAKLYFKQVLTYKYKYIYP